MVNKSKNYYYLALGDSYTIGEAVQPEDNFPNQATSLLKKYLKIETRIIAKTGWTTDELWQGMIKADRELPLLTNYDFVSLLIGVNNQYRGQEVNEYIPGFKKLLLRSIGYAGNDPGKVIVLSIPDWGVTPYAEGRDRKKIAVEIDSYNAAAKKIAGEAGVDFFDITAWTREATSNPALLAADGLHPSGKEYKRWANLVAGYFHSKTT
jgi:lysophospholipase L1-like esterase